jgi:hypothetical protein
MYAKFIDCLFIHAQIKLLIDCFYGVPRIKRHTFLVPALLSAHKHNIRVWENSYKWEHFS